ncbi:Undefined function [Listeria monocytogenes N53-1]|nr:Undefined function [Listeria monocytogenes N53-1]
MTLKEAGLTEDKLIKMYETMLMARRLSVCGC